MARIQHLLSRTRFVPYHRIDRFLPAAAADAILAALIARPDEFRGRGRQLAADRAMFSRLRQPLEPPAPFRARLVEALTYMGPRFSVDLCHVDIELVAQAYNDGSLFRRHSDIDAGGPNWQRRLSGIYYVHRRPRGFEGGELVVYDRRRRGHRIAPDHNSAVFFPCDLEHEVLPVTCVSGRFEDSRFAINIWIS